MYDVSHQGNIKIKIFAIVYCSLNVLGRDSSQWFQILSKTRLSDLLKEVDPTMVLEEDVEEVLMSYADQFIDNVIEGACTLAKHRQNNTIDVKDVQQYLSTYFIFIFLIVSYFKTKLQCAIITFGHLVRERMN